MSTRVWTVSTMCLSRGGILIPGLIIIVTHAGKSIVDFDKDFKGHCQVKMVF